MVQAQTTEPGEILESIRAQYKAIEKSQAKITQTQNILDEIHEALNDAITKENLGVNISLITAGVAVGAFVLGAMLDPGTGLKSEALAKIISYTMASGAAVSIGGMIYTGIKTSDAKSIQKKIELLNQQLGKQLRALAQKRLELKGTVDRFYDSMIAKANKNDKALLSRILTEETNLQLIIQASESALIELNGLQQNLSSTIRTDAGIGYMAIGASTIAALGLLSVVTGAGDVFINEAVEKINNTILQSASVSVAFDAAASMLIKVSDSTNLLTLIKSAETECQQNRDAAQSKLNAIEAMIERVTLH